MPEQTTAPSIGTTIGDELSTLVANAIALTHFAESLEEPRLVRCALDLSNRLQKLEADFLKSREVVNHG